VLDCVEVAAFTMIEKLGRETVPLPSLALITMPGYVPTSDGFGTPWSIPWVVLKLAQPGLLAMLYPIVAPAGALVVACTAYWLPTVAVGVGVP
jgi:hypothetical protein